MVLTRSSRANAIRMLQSNGHTQPLDLYEEIYYLSDSGLSRVAIDDATGKIYLTGESIESTRINWAYAQRERQAVEAEIMQFMAEYE